MINVHFSLLPRWRGAAPVERAILAGDDVTGVCVMRLEAGLDTGPVLASGRADRPRRARLGSASSGWRPRGADLLVEVLADGCGRPRPGAAPGGRAHLRGQARARRVPPRLPLPADELHRIVRLDRAWTTFRGERLRVLDAVARRPRPTARRGRAAAPTPPGDGRRRSVGAGVGLPGAASRSSRRGSAHGRPPTGAAGSGSRRGRARGRGPGRTTSRLGVRCSRSPRRCCRPTSAAWPRRSARYGRGGLAPHRRHGRPLRPQPDHRPAGGGVAAPALGALLRLPPDDDRPRWPTWRRSGRRGPTAAPSTSRWGTPPRCSARPGRSAFGPGWPSIRRPPTRPSTPSWPTPTSSCA